MNSGDWRWRLCIVVFAICELCVFAFVFVSEKVNRMTSCFVCLFVQERFVRSNSNSNCVETKFYRTHNTCTRACARHKRSRESIKRMLKIEINHESNHQSSHARSLLVVRVLLDVKVFPLRRQRLRTQRQRGRAGQRVRALICKQNRMKHEQEQTNTNQTFMNGVLAT